MSTSIQNNRNILDLSSDFRAFIEKNGWVTRYDIESDAFSVTKPKLSKDARIKYFDDEIGFYVAKGNIVEGVFVEYFGSNFVKHHKDLRAILKDIKDKDTKKEGLIQLNKEKIKKIAPDIQGAIRDVLVENLRLDFKLG